MAESPENAPPPEGGICGVAGSTWLGGWIETAKSKSVSALEFVKKDLTEFTHTMHTDSEAIATDVRSKLTPEPTDKWTVMQETASTATMKVKHGMSMLLDGIKSALIIPPDEMGDDEAEAIVITSSEHIFDRAKARLHAIQIDPGTYCNEPTGAKEKFDEWLSTVDLEGKKGDISELLVSHVEVRALYTQMVPTTVSHSDFWQRYFYKMHQLEQEDQRRADLMKRVNVKDEADLAWDDEDDWENMDSSNKKVPPVVTEKETVPDKHSQPDKQTEEQRPTAIPNCESIKPTDSIISRTDTINSDVSSNVTECSSQELSKDLSAETLTIVSAESPSSVTADDAESFPQSEAVAGEGDQEKADKLKIKDKGDLVVVGTTNSSEGTSPSSSDSHSHNKESLDEDWEKDFDIEVTEEDVRQAQESSNDTKLKGEEDWENWE